LRTNPNAVASLFHDAQLHMISPVIMLLARAAHRRIQQPDLPGELRVIEHDQVRANINLENSEPYVPKRTPTLMGVIHRKGSAGWVHIRSERLRPNALESVAIRREEDQLEHRPGRPMMMVSVTTSLPVTQVKWNCIFDLKSCWFVVS
jgi:hypothetical protein